MTPACLSYQVTVLQQSRSSGSETFTFPLDESLKNITLYITGSQITFTITNPAGITTCQGIYRQALKGGSLE